MRIVYTITEPGEASISLISYNCGLSGILRNLAFLMRRFPSARITAEEEA